MSHLKRLTFAIFILLNFAIGNAQRPSVSLEEAKRKGLARSVLRDTSLRQESPRDLADARQGTEAFDRSIAPILKRSCQTCHGPENQEASFRVDTLDPDFIDGDDASWWLEVMQVLSNGEMPPADSEFPIADKDRAGIIHWVSRELQFASQVAHRESGHSSFRRMSRYEYNYALQDLLGLPYDFAQDLPPETPSEDGLFNSSSMLHVSVSQLSTYRRLAKNALLKATVQGDAPEPIYYSITMDAATELMTRGELKQIERLKARSKSPEKLAEQIAKIRQSMHSFRQGTPHFINLDTGVGVQGRYRYSGARYSWTPLRQQPVVPPVSRHVLVMPPGREQILDLGDQLPDSGTMRIRLRAGSESGTVSQFGQQLRIQFGFQASNNSQTDFHVGEDLHVDSSSGAPAFYVLDVPLGEISRNPYRGSMKLGETPNPSEYIVLQNRSEQPIHVDYIEITAPFHSQWPPASHQKIFLRRDADQDDTQYARDVLASFMRKAWRRDVTDQELDQKLGLLSRLLENGDHFHAAMTDVLATVLASPNFLYVTPTKADDGSLEQYAMASRISMFLWCSSPDTELLSLAKQGRLNDPAILSEQVERMLLDPRSKRLAKHFVRQWLGLQGLDYLNFDRKAFPSFDDDLKEAMAQEPIALFEHVLKHNLSVMDFLHADYAVVNARLAKHYGIEGIQGNRFRAAPLPMDAQRGGLLTQAGIMAMNSDGKDSHPLKRGIWLLENLLNDPPPPPPPAVPEIDLTDPDILKLSLKERMEDHRDDPACRSCHARIDPWGIALENYDAIGMWRNRIGSRDVDSVSVLFNGQTLNGAEGLKRYLLENRQDQFVRSLTHKLTTYALGRPLSFSDRAEVEQIAQNVRQNGDGLATLIHQIIGSDLFQMP